KLLNNRLNEVAEQENELLKEHCYLDDKGNPKKKFVNGTEYWDVKDVEAFSKDKTELYEEEMVIEGGNNHEMLKTVKEILLNCDREFSGQEAEVYDYLCDQFEKGGDE